MRQVLLVPGQAFSPENKPSSYVRASFSIASEADMEEGLQRLADLLREQQKRAESAAP